MNKRLLYTIVFILVFNVTYLCAQTICEKLPNWSEGVLEIHNINTGRGNSVFCIMPDGTTMIIDAGHVSSEPSRRVPAVPDSTQSPGLLISEYIKSVHPDKINAKLDYVFLTHFHSDHIGGVFDRKSTKGDYFLSGITEVFEEIPIMRIIDRGYPAYDYLPPSNDSAYINYRKFTSYLTELDSNFIEGFKVGSCKQFMMQYDLDNKYIDKFEIRNVIGNGVVWTGIDSNTKNLFPENLEALQKNEVPRENSLSCGIRISYGKFDYYNGGDLTGYPKPGNPSWHDLETPLAKVLGKTEVANVNHHGNDDATNDSWLKLVSPQVLIIQASDALHPNHSTLTRMTSRNLYNPADIFSTNMHHAARTVIGNLVDRMKSTQGHIVIRVSKNGDSYMIYILDDSDNTLSVKDTFGPYICED